MTPPHSEDRLLQKIVARTDTDSASEPHLDDETLALFAAGELTAEHWQSAVRHLADCATCRQIASLLTANWPEESPMVAAQPLPSTRSRRAWLVPAAAAALLLVAGLLVFGRRETSEMAERRTHREASRLLAASDFSQARAALDQAARQGVRSDRLLSLQSQAVRELRGEVALASSGRLMDFGYGVDGVIARGPETQRGLNEARQLLLEAKGDDFDVRLNRGHLWLSQGDLDLARTEFSQVLERHPKQPLAWLGLGLAEFLREDWSAAETAFRKSAELDPENLAPQINLALTLDEQDRRDEALQIWQRLAERPLSATDRDLVTKAIQELTRRE